jgi:hypothetical protein
LTGIEALSETEEEADPFTGVAFAVFGDGESISWVCLPARLKPWKRAILLTSTSRESGLPVL